MIAVTALVDSEVVLMVILSFKESGSRYDLGDNGLLELACSLYLCLDLLCSCFLFRCVIEHRRSILCADVVPLSVKGGRVVDTPKESEKIFILHLIGEVLNLDDLCVASFTSAYILVAWIDESTAHVASINGS